MKYPSFFCENCGKEVSSGMDRCPSCGREFSSVRCPECGFSGESEKFLHGCPGCGYAAGQEKDISPGLYFNKLNSKTKISPPAWFYKVGIVALVLILIGLIRAYLSL